MTTHTGGASSVGQPVPFPASQSKLSTILKYRADPLRRFVDLRENYPAVCGFRLLGRHAIVVHDPKAIEDILVKQHACFTKDTFTGQLREVIGEGLLTSEAERHRRHRRLVAPYLAATEVAEYAQAMLDRAQDFARAQAPGSLLEVRSAMMRLTLDILVRTLFGQEFSGFQAVEEPLEAIMRAFRPGTELVRSLTPQWVPLPSRLRLRRARRELHKIVDQLILDKRRAPSSSDLLSRLISARDAGEEQGLSDQELRDEVLTMFLAGHETTALSLTYLLRLLAMHPDSRKRVESEIDAALAKDSPLVERLRGLPYTHACFQEVLRLYPPAWVLGRQAIKDCSVGGWHLPKGSEVFIPIVTLQRHPAWFERADQFFPERYLEGGSAVVNPAPRFAYTPFGAGPRVCVGQHFALLEAMAVLAGLLRERRFDLRRWQRFRLAPSITLRPAHNISMRVSAR